MNIFGVGEIELLLIILIALVIAGPKRLIQWAYTLGRWTAKLRRMWSEAMVLLQRELDEAGLGVELPKDVPTRGSVRRTVETALKPLAEPVKEAMDEVKSVGTELKTTSRQTQQQLTGIKTDMQKAGATPPGATKPAAAAGVNGTPRTGTTSRPAADRKPTGEGDGNEFGTWSGSEFGTWSDQSGSTSSGGKQA